MGSIELEISDKILLTLALMAHEKNITLNELIIEILEKFLKDQDIIKSIDEIGK